MMKLTREQMSLRDSLANELENLYDELKSLAEKYREKLVEAQVFCQWVADEIEEYVNDKSEAWRESGYGGATDSWREEWENVEFPEVDLDGDPADVLRSLDAEPKNPDN